jgi:hypothetical protein
LKAVTASPPTPYCFCKSAEAKERKGVAAILAHGKSEKSAEEYEKKQDEWCLVTGDS